jgi:hypothetical protein
MPTVLTIYKVANLIGALILPDIETALKIKAAFHNLGPDYKANIQSLADAAGAANDETIAKVNTWLAANGYDPLPADPLKAV